MSIMRSLIVIIFTLLFLPVKAEQINIAVASNFIKPMKKIVQIYEKQSGHKVVMSFGSSGKFFAQISHGAPYHIFFSADQEKIIALEKANLIIKNSRFTYAIGALVLWSPTEGYFTDGAAFLADGHFKKLAMANPKLAPYGRAAQEVLAYTSLSEQVRTKQVIAENIAQAFQFATTGNAEIGLIALSQVMNNGVISSGSSWVIPHSYYQPIKQDAAILKRAKNNQVSQDFIAFMRSSEVKSIMTSFGYTTSQYEH